jgi:hypothetical protein
MVVIHGEHIVALGTASSDFRFWTMWSVRMFLPFVRGAKTIPATKSLILSIMRGSEIYATLDAHMGKCRFHVQNSTKYNLTSQSICFDFVY